MNDPIAFSNGLLVELQAKDPDYDQIRRSIIRMYNEDTGNSLEEDINPTDERLSDVVGWMNLRLTESDDWTRFFRSEPVLLQLFFSSLSDKAGTLAQYHCPICSRRNEGPVNVIPIRIPPTSAQSRTPQYNESRIKQAFIRAMKSHFEGPIYKTPTLPLYPDGSLCVHVTFVVSKYHKARDLDNLAKVLLDSLQGLLFKNDRQIDHLSLLRLQTEDAEEYMVLNVRASSVNQHIDVLYRKLRHGWAGQEELRLADFME